MMVEVSYLELREAPRSSAGPTARTPGPERIAPERLALEPYLALYRRVGGPHGWGQRLRMPRPQLEALLEGDRLEILVARGPSGEPLGLCEFDRTGFPEVELKNFGLVPEAQGRGLGPRLLDAALRAEWRRGPTRIWLHTDTLDHPAAMRAYERAGFRVYEVRMERPEDL
jgi:ribosomal protein S18 acetylase RimI-like enzyme